MTTRPSPLEPPASKGAGFITVVSVLRETVPDALMTSYVASLPEATAALLRVPPIAMEWLPIEHFYAVIDHAQSVLYRGNANDVADLGYESIRRDLTALYRLLVRVSSVEAILSRTSRLWSAYNRNHGTVTVQMLSRTAADVAYEGIPPHAPAAFWAFQRGALRAVVEATGVRNVRARILSPPNASGACVLRISGDRDDQT
jgi:hypothetical protein